MYVHTCGYQNVKHVAHLVQCSPKVGICKTNIQEYCIKNSAISHITKRLSGKDLLHFSMHNFFQASHTRPKFSMLHTEKQAGPGIGSHMNDVTML